MNVALIYKIPTDCQLEVFSYLDLSETSKVACASKELNKLATDVFEEWIKSFSKEKLVRDFHSTLKVEGARTFVKHFFSRVDLE